MQRRFYRDRCSTFVRRLKMMLKVLLNLSSAPIPIARYNIKIHLSIRASVEKVLLMVIMEAYEGDAPIIQTLTKMNQSPFQIYIFWETT